MVVNFDAIGHFGGVTRSCADFRLRYNYALNERDGLQTRVAGILARRAAPAPLAAARGVAAIGPYDYSYL